MKIAKERYEIIKDGIIRVLDYYGVDKLKKEYEDKSDTRFVFDLMWKVWSNLYCPDTHPYFVHGKWDRIIPCENMNIFVEGDTHYTSDHMTTALRKIGRELGLVRKEWVK